MAFDRSGKFLLLSSLLTRLYFYIYFLITTQMNPSEQFMLAANSVHEVEVGVRPLAVGSKFMYINVVGILFFSV